MINNVLLEELIDKYQKGFSIQQLSKEYHKKPDTISKALKSMGIEIKRGLRKKIFTGEQQRDIINMYRCHSGINEIARKYNCDITLINRVLKENQIDKVTWKKVNKNIIEDFFETIDTEEKAYLLGLLTTDGYVKNLKSRNNFTIGISLQVDDRATLEWIKKILCLDCKIQEDKRANKECFTIEWASAKMAQDLAQYGIIPNKTYSLTHLSNKIPEKLFHHYLRGLYDGDGICSIVNQNDASIGFCAYYESFVQDFQLAIDKAIGKNFHNKIEKGNVYNCHWRGRIQILSILNYLYSNSTCFLQRKYDKYQFLLTSL